MTEPPYMLSRAYTLGLQRWGEVPLPYGVDWMQGRLGVASKSILLADRLCLV